MHRYALLLLFAVVLTAAEAKDDEAKKDEAS